MSARGAMPKTPKFKFACCAVDCGDACEDEGVYRIPTALMNRAMYSSGGGFGRSLRFDTDRADEPDRCYVCGEHAMQTVLSIFGRGLAEGKREHEEDAGQEQPEVEEPATTVKRPRASA